MEQTGHPVHRSIADIHHAICEQVGAIDSLPVSAPVEPAVHTSSEVPPASNPQSTNGGTVEAGTVVAGHGKGGRLDGRCLALRDYYPFWRENLEAAAAGKLLPVDLCENPKVTVFLLSERNTFVRSVETVVVCVPFIRCDFFLRPLGLSLVHAYPSLWHLNRLGCLSCLLT